MSGEPGEDPRAEEPELTIEKGEPEEDDGMQNPVTLSLSLYSPMATLSVSATYDDPAPAVIDHVTARLRGALGYLVGAERDETPTQVRVSRGAS